MDASSVAPGPSSLVQRPSPFGTPHGGLSCLIWHHLLSVARASCPCVSRASCPRFEGRRPSGHKAGTASPRLDTSRSLRFDRLACRRPRLTMPSLPATRIGGRVEARIRFCLSADRFFLFIPDYRSGCQGYYRDDRMIYPPISWEIRPKNDAGTAGWPL